MMTKFPEISLTVDEPFSTDLVGHVETPSMLIPTGENDAP